MPDCVLVLPGCVRRRHVPVIWVRVVVLVIVMAFAAWLLWFGHAVPMVVWVLTMVGEVTLMLAPAQAGGRGDVWARCPTPGESRSRRHV
ncbi:hypothetical protein ACFQ1S_09895 [Kibdelosporangium lantanae]|uniref:Uncharacterized protein n=1 Tax=Kibdelosporangium lantanae TaxID=1497396 RepID=A0ABW3M6Z8_9PSEU